MAKKKTAVEEPAKAPVLRSTPIETPLADGTMTAQVRFDDDNVVYIKYKPIGEGQPNEAVTIKNKANGNYNETGLYDDGPEHSKRFWMPSAQVKLDLAPGTRTTFVEAFPVGTAIISNAFIKKPVPDVDKLYTVGNLAKLITSDGTDYYRPTEEVLVRSPEGSSTYYLMINDLPDLPETLKWELAPSPDSYNCTLTANGKRIQVTDPSHSVIAHLVVHFKEENQGE